MPNRSPLFSLRPSLLCRGSTNTGDRWTQWRQQTWREWPRWEERMRGSPSMAAQLWSWALWSLLLWSLHLHLLHRRIEGGHTSGIATEPATAALNERFQNSSRFDPNPFNVINRFLVFQTIIEVNSFKTEISRGITDVYAIRLAYTCCQFIQGRRFTTEHDGITIFSPCTNNNLNTYQGLFHSRELGYWTTLAPSRPMFHDRTREMFRLIVE